MCICAGKLERSDRNNCSKSHIKETYTRAISKSPTQKTDKRDTKEPMKEPQKSHVQEPYKGVPDKSSTREHFDNVQVMYLSSGRKHTETYNTTVLDP